MLLTVDEILVGAWFFWGGRHEKNVTGVSQ